MSSAVKGDWESLFLVEFPLEVLNKFEGKRIAATNSCISGGSDGCNGSAVVISCE